MKASYYFSHKGALDILVYMGWGAILVNLLVGVFLRLPILESMAYFIVPFLYIMVGLWAWPYLSKHIKGVDLAVYIGVILFSMFQYLIYPERTELYNELIPRFLFSSIPFFIIGTCVDFERYEKPFFYISLVCLAWGFLYSFALMQQKATFDEEANEYMDLSYRYLPHVLYIIYYTFKKFNLYNLAFSLAGVFLIFSYGTRGPALMLFIFILGLYFFFHRFKHGFLAFLIGIVLFAFAYIYYEQILLFMQMLIDSVGMKTRIIDRILVGEFANSDGRESFIPIMIKKIKLGGLFGYGMAGSWQFIQTYPHNILMDFWISFGILPGSVLFLALVYLIFKGFKSCNSNDEKAFLFLLTIRGFLMLFLSHNYFVNEYLYFLIGYCVYLSFRRNGNGRPAAVGPVYVS